MCYFYYGILKHFFVWRTEGLKEPLSTATNDSQLRAFIVTRLLQFNSIQSIFPAYPVSIYFIRQRIACWVLSNLEDFEHIDLLSSMYHWKQIIRVVQVFKFILTSMCICILLSSYNSLLVRSHSITRTDCHESVGVIALDLSTPL